MKSEEIIINGENAVLGRLASYAAKQALLGKDVVIINSEKVIITGREKEIVDRYNKKRTVGGYGPKPVFSSMPERILKRTIRNMLPYKHGRGKKAFGKIKCYSGIPGEFEGKKIIKAGRGKKGVSLEKIKNMFRGK